MRAGGTAERFTIAGTRTALAMTLGLAAFVGDHKSTQSDEVLPRPEAVAAATGRAAMDDQTITGFITSFDGAPVPAKNSPSGDTVTRRLEDGSEVQIRCQAYGNTVLGGVPEDVPDLTANTWYKLETGGESDPNCPEQWVNQERVLSDDPIPSCPPS